MQQNDDRLLKLQSKDKAETTVLSLIPMCASKWIKGVKAGTYPQPVRLPDNRSVYWRYSDISKLISGGE